QQHETWAKKNIFAYAALPNTLTFTGQATPDKSLQTAFQESIRINPLMNFPLFLHLEENQKNEIYSPITQNDVILPLLIHEPSLRFLHLPLKKINPSDKVSPLQIIATAADEPDYGMDINLWEDNNTWFGMLYRLGKQPYGNSTVIFSSQIPFHMGFFYEATSIYLVAPFLKQTYVEYRIHLYLTLAEFAFKTGHPYWGYRFLGWSLHYLQDLGQPYHSTLFPNYSANIVIFAHLLYYLHCPLQQHLIQLITNRHFALENYTSFSLLRSGDNPFVAALNDESNDYIVIPYSDEYPRHFVAGHSHALASTVDSAIKNTFAEKYVRDPHYLFYTTEPDINLVAVSQQINTQKLDSILIILLQDVGRNSRNLVRYAISHSCDTGLLATDSTCNKRKDPEAPLDSSR
ncbi:hypothetical protein AYO45_02100, partial [Gammaproteobacteria bacterium SCGC AG-212-F23]